MSVEQIFGLIAPTALAGWFWMAPHSPDGFWPRETPLQWLASTSERAGLSGSWAANTTAWIGEREGLFWWYVGIAALLTGHANLQVRPTAFLGLATIGYAATLELYNSPSTLLIYLAASGVVCLFAVLYDRRASAYRDGYLSIPGLSFMKWVTSISVVGFNWFTLPVMAVFGAIEGYRIERLPEPRVPTGASVVPLRSTSLPPGRSDKSEVSTSGDDVS